MGNKQTAVEWLANQIAEMPNTYLTGKYGFIELSGVVGDKVYRINADIMYLIDEAKQMEKDQMIEFAMHLHKVDDSKTGTDILMDEAEQYYNETYANDTTEGLPKEDSKRRAWHY